MKTRVLIESPFAGRHGAVCKCSDCVADVETNKRYALAAMRDSLLRGEAPFVSHLLYTQVLDDQIPAEREIGIAAGLDFGEAAQLTAVYVDRGVSSGMQRGITRAALAARPVERRTVPGWLS